MSRTFRGGSGEINDILAYASSAATGFSVVSTPAPAQGTYRIKATGTTSANISMIINKGHLFTDTYRWQCQRDYRLAGTLNAAQEVKCMLFGASNRFVGYWVYESASSYKFRLKDDIAPATHGTSSSTYTAGGSPEDIDLRIQTDGSRVKLWINGVLEIDAATTYELAAGYMVYYNTTLAASQDMYWGASGAWESSSEADRPGFAVKKWYMPLAGDGSSASFENDDACEEDGSGGYIEWDDWNSAGVVDDDTTFNQLCGAHVGLEISTLTNVTITDPENAGVVVRARLRAILGSKTVDTYFRIEDGTDNVEIQNDNLSSTSYLIKAAAFDGPPDAGADWSQGDFDNLRAGMRKAIGSGDDNLRVTALGVEVISVDDDPPAGRRRILAQVIGG